MLKNERTFYTTYIRESVHTPLLFLRYNGVYSEVDTFLARFLQGYDVFLPSLNMENPIEHDQNLLALAQSFVTLLDAFQSLACQEGNLSLERLGLANNKGSSSTVDNAVTPPKHEPIKDESDIIKWVGNVEKAGYFTSVVAEDIIKGLKISTTVLRRFKPIGGHGSLPSQTINTETNAKESIEQDFTTDGPRGVLHCPFIGPGGTTAVKPDDGNIRIKSSSHTDTISMPPSHHSAQRCPIRSLDNLSPEELAEYFQNHKHEIPRSHSICIRRYQRNSQSARQLDEKYGNVASMVKGLGEYHQPYLSAPFNQPGSPQTGPISSEKVENWANNIDDKAARLGVDCPAGNEIEYEAVDTREGHFDRTLRDVRVGESPSRPWGIHVPISQDQSQGARTSPMLKSVDHSVKRIPSGNQTARLSSQSSPRTENMAAHVDGRRCPFGHTDKPHISIPEGETTLKEPRDDRSSHHTADTHHPPQTPRISSRKPSHPHLTFNGPVFFGYDAESAGTLLEKLGAQAFGS